MFPRKSDDTLAAAKQQPQITPQLHHIHDHHRNDITREPERARHVQPSAAAAKANAVGVYAADKTAATSTSHHNNGRMRRPPGLPASCSSSSNSSSANSNNNHKNRASIVNLDKNRIRQTRRLLPRPLSLPSGFNLMRPFSKQLAEVAEVTAAPPDIVSAEQSPDTATTVDIALIKQLEDDIYNRKANVLPKKSQCRNGGPSGDCPHCSAAFVPNQVLEQRTIHTRDSVANQAIMLLDAWQMEPLLMKYAKPPKTEAATPAAVPPTQGTRSIIIIDNSSFYPTVMKYDIKTQPSRLEDKPIVGPKQEFVRPVDAPAKTNNSNLFQRCLGRPTSDSASDNEHSDGDNDPNRIIANAQPPLLPLPPTQRKLSKFKRFVLQRRSLNLHSTCTEPTSAAQPSPIPPVVTYNGDAGTGSLGGLGDSTADRSQLKSDKHAMVTTTGEHQSRRWLHAAEPSKNTATGSTLASYGRQWRSDDDIYSTIVVNDSAVEHPDLRELERMQHQLDQLSADLAEKRRQLQLEQRDEPRAAAIKKRSPSMLMLFGQAAPKRHSIGSPTDVVKTWVYRRR